MPIMVENVEYMSVLEACEYLGVSRQTLRLRAKENHILAYKQGVTRNVYYKKSDLDSLKALRPVDPSQDIDDEQDEAD